MIDRNFSQFHRKNHVTSPKIHSYAAFATATIIRRMGQPESVRQCYKMTNVRQKRVNQTVFKIKILGLRLHFCRYAFIHGE